MSEDPGKPFPKRVKNWILDSLSGFNITAKIQLSICSILGFGPEEQASLSDLERRLVEAVEGIARRGKSPLILFDNEIVWEAFCALLKQFPRQMTTVGIRDAKGNDLSQELPVFESLHQYALAIRTDDIKIQEYKRLMGITEGISERKRLSAQIETLKTRIQDRSALFQKIIFAEADRAERGELDRLLTRDGQRAPLESFVEMDLEELDEVDIFSEDLDDPGPPLPETSEELKPQPISSQQTSPQAPSEPLQPKPRVTQTIRPSQKPPSAKPAAKPVTPPNPASPPKPPAPPKKEEKVEVLDWQELQNEELDLEDVDSSFKLDF